jgi:hypothetical protein
MAYKKHMMYGDGESEMAQTNAEHLSLKKKGWGHEKPSGFKLREVNSPMLCWKTHERVPGTTKGAKKSCQHKNPAKRPK